MKYSLKVLMSLFLMAMSLGAVAQSVCEVQGAVVDAAGEAIPYATVGAYKGSENVVRKVADIGGVFKLQLIQGETYTIEITTVGDVPFKKSVQLPNEATYNMGVIEMQPATELDEVVVVAQKPIIKADAEKITYDVLADPSSGTNTLLDMMRKVPLVTVDGQDNVQLNGASDFKLLINGKESVMAKNNMKELLKSMPASNVEEIQVISNPSIRYDAEGTGGVINIVTRRIEKQEVGGIMATLSASYNPLQGGVDGSAFLAAQHKKFTLSFNYAGGFINRYNITASEQTNFNTPDFYHYITGTIDKARVKSHYHMFSLESSYELDKNNLFTVGVTGSMAPSNVEENAREEAFSQSGDRVMNFIRNNKSYTLWGGVSANANYQHTFDRRQHMITLSYLYEYNPNNSFYKDSTLFDDETLNAMFEGQMNENVSFSHQHTAQVDYNNPLNDTHSIEAGAKYIMRLNSSSDDYMMLHNGAWQSMNGRQIFDYTQQIASLYAGYAFNKEVWGFRVGGRYEMTFVDALSQQGDLKVEYGKPYGNFVPYASINYNITPMESLRLSYTNRINRPGINYLSPYEDWQGATHVSVGNPDLKPTLSHSISAAYSLFMGAFNINMQWRSRFTNNAITRVSIVEPATAVTRTTYANIAQNQSHGMNIFVSGMPSPKFNYSLSVSPYYTIYNAPHLNKKIDSWGISCFGSVDLMPWKNGRIGINGGGGKSPETLNTIQLTWWYFYGISIAQTFFDEKLKVTLSAQNIFDANYNWTYKSYGNGYEMISTNIFPMHSLSLGVSYTFGNLDANVKKARRGIKNDDLVGGAGESRESGQSQGDR